MKTKFLIIAVISTQLLLTSCAYQGDHLISPHTNGQGDNAVSCKSVKNSCQIQGSYEEWWNENNKEMSCACRGAQ